MDVIHQPPEWFTSELALRKFASLTTKEDKTIFIYSYLRQVANQTFPSERLVFQTAFLLADEVLGSSLPYGAYPAIISPTDNPFVAYLVNGRYLNDGLTLAVFLALLRSKVDHTNQSSWIYFKGNLEETVALAKQEDCDFYNGDAFAPPRERYVIDDTLQTLQLKIIWMLSER